MSSIINTLLGPSPQYYIPKFMEIRPLIQEKEIFRVFTIYGFGGYLGHVSNVILNHYHFLVLNSLHTKFG